jgi:peptide/nickel transport system permease protein
MSRWRYFGKRLLMTIPVLWLGLSTTWFIIYMGPVDPAANMLSETNMQDQEAYRNAQDRLGLDESPLEHYTDWMWNMVTFDWGHTWLVYPGTPVDALVIDFLPRTVWLGFWSVLIAICVGVPMGFFAGLRSNTGSDYFTSFGGIVWRAMPNFWLAVMLLTLMGSTQDLLFGFSWQAFGVPLDALSGNPQLGYMADDPLNLFLKPMATAAAIKKILPAALVLGSASMGNEMRIGRTAVLETKREQYVDFARAKGVSDRVLVWKHIFRNALVPLVPIITSEAFLLIGGSVLVESVFGINGIGWLFFRTAIQGDLPTVAVLMFVFIVIILSINIFQDFLYMLVDPRVGYEGQE